MAETRPYADWNGTGACPVCTGRTSIPGTTCPLCGRVFGNPGLLRGARPVRLVLNGVQYNGATPIPVDLREPDIVPGIEKIPWDPSHGCGVCYNHRQVRRKGYGGMGAICYPCPQCYGR